MKQNADRLQLDRTRCQAAKFFAENFSREKRFLVIFRRDFSEFLKSSEWLKSPDGKRNQKYFDFLISFEELKDKMKEFRWSKDFLAENGIDFSSIRNLYFAVA